MHYLYCLFRLNLKIYHVYKNANRYTISHAVFAINPAHNRLISLINNFKPLIKPKTIHFNSKPVNNNIALDRKLIPLLILPPIPPQLKAIVLSMLGKILLSLIALINAAIILVILILITLILANVKIPIKDFVLKLLESA